MSNVHTYIHSYLPCIHAVFSSQAFLYNNHEPLQFSQKLGIVQFMQLPLLLVAIHYVYDKYVHMCQRRRKIFEARVLRGRRTHGQGVCAPQMLRRLLKLNMGNFTFVNLYYASNFYRHIATYISNIYARPSLLCSSFYL